MSFLLDTDTCSYHLRRPSGLAHRFVQHQGRIFVPSVVLAELYVWVYRRDDPTHGLEAMSRFVRHEVQLLDHDHACAEKFGRVRAGLLRKGISVDRFDLLIASVALVNDLTLVTHNTADFQNIPDLRLVELDTLIGKLIDAGEFQTAGQVVGEALRLLAERRRDDFHWW